SPGADTAAAQRPARVFLPPRPRRLPPARPGRAVRAASRPARAVVSTGARVGRAARDGDDGGPISRRPVGERVGTGDLRNRVRPRLRARRTARRPRRRARSRHGGRVDRGRSRRLRAGAHGRDADARARRRRRAVGVSGRRHARRSAVPRARLPRTDQVVSYTLRGRIESRLAAFVPVVVAACVIAAGEHRWWPVDAAGLMLGVGLALDVQAYHRVLRYQPGWAALPLGALELALVLLLMRAAGVAAPLGQAVALFTGGWLLSQLLAHAGFPLLRLTYAEDGGELGRLGGTAAVAAAAVLAGAGSTAYALRPPVVHLASGVHQGPIVITRREVLVGDPGAVVRGGIVVRASGVTVKNVSVVGGDYGISVEHVHGTVLDGVSVSGARLDGIHVRLAGVVVRDCSVDMLGNELGQGIDISYTM